MPSSIPDHRSPRALLLLAAFILVVIGVGGLIGASNVPGIWYQGLQKLWFNPPSWVFAPAWITLYLLIAIAGWRTFLRDSTGQPMKLWGVQMLLNWAWSPVFFGLQLPWPAFGVIVALWLAILSFIVTSRRADTFSAWLFAPYIAWVSFAALLNLAIALLN
jgi:benzodiazapine receptor